MYILQALIVELEHTALFKTVKLKKNVIVVTAESNYNQAFYTAEYLISKRTTILSKRHHKPAMGKTGVDYKISL